MSFGTFAQFLDKKCNVTSTTFLIACSPQLSCNQRHSISSLRGIHNEVLGTVRYQKVGESCACDLIWEGGGVEQGTLEASCLLGRSVCTECRRRDLAQSHHKGVTCRGRVADEST